VLLVLSLAAGAAAIAQWRQASEQERKATEQERVATAQQLAASARELVSPAPRASAMPTPVPPSGSPSPPTGSTPTPARASLLATLTATPIKATLAGHTDLVTAVALAADGRTALTGSHDRTAILWDRSREIEFAAHVVDHACAAAGRGLSQDEWAEAIPGVPYEETCP
jgi:WD40 repeat protein